MKDYSGNIATAKRLITVYGDQCQWIKRGVEKGPVYIAFVSQGNLISLLSETLGAESAQNRGSYDAIMHAVNFDPEQGDLVIRSDGTELLVGNMNEFKPGSQSIMHFIKFQA